MNLQSSIFNSPLKRDLRFAPTGLSGLGSLKTFQLIVRFDLLDRLAQLNGLKSLEAKLSAQPI